MARNVMNTLSRSYCDVERDISGRLSGYTVIYNSTDVFNRMVECKYFYVDGYCDYLRSEGFGAGSMASDRVRACKKKNKGVSDPWLQKRFYSIDKGFFSLKELFGEKNYPNGTDQTRLKSIHNKLKGVSTYEKPSVLRWCSARVCGCMGAMNCSMRKYSTMTKEEHEDLLCYLKFNALEHEYSKLFYATMGS